MKAKETKVSHGFQRTLPASVSQDAGGCMQANMGGDGVATGDERAGRPGMHDWQKRSEKRPGQAAAPDAHAAQAPSINIAPIIQLPAESGAPAAAGPGAASGEQKRKPKVQALSSQDPTAPCLPH